MTSSVIFFLIYNKNVLPLMVYKPIYSRYSMMGSIFGNDERSRNQRRDKTETGAMRGVGAREEK